HGGHRAGELRGIDLDPVGPCGSAERVLQRLEVLALAASLTDLDAIALPDVERGDVGRAAVDREMAMAHQLACLGTATGEAHAVDDIVEARLEQAQEVLAGDARAGLRGV